MQTDCERGAGDRDADKQNNSVAVETKALSTIAAAPFSAKAWTREKRAAFLAELAATSNVKASAKAAGLPEVSAYRLRRESAEFRYGWEAALCEGYAKLEHMMLERAMKALRRIGDVDAAKTRMEEYSNKLALGLLSAHRASAKGERPPAFAARPNKGSAKARIQARFADMRDRVNSGT